MPSACATAGMISASGGGVLLGEGRVGVTRLTETVVVLVLVAWGVTRELLDSALVVMATPPTVVPIASWLVSTVMVRLMPPAGTIPEDGVTVMNDRFGVAVNDRPASDASSGIE